MKRTEKLKPRGIERGAVYPKQEFCERMGWGQKAWRSACRRGLPWHKESRFIYVVADEAAEWMKNRKPANASK